MIVLPSTYLGSVEYFAYLAQRGGECVVDIHEHYIKRSERNRTQIMTANGVMPLSVHIVNANRPRTPMHKVHIDYSKRWQHQHWIAIVSAYRSSPYFEHYAPLLEPFYTSHYDSLVEFNTALTKQLMRLLGIDGELHLSEAYIEAAEGDVDLRIKKRESHFDSPRYFQLFSDRFPFEPNLSIVDLLFAEGPAAIDFLRRCRL
ncbi:MAG: WbqC family protein [Alistipes sp.]|nr:WbqC family protein [Alistipes sp.]MBQ2703633.1 WbqC family protein [Alistipes sp.]